MSLISSETKGVIVIGVTPFKPDGAIDFDTLDRLTDFYFEAGADGLTILGMMGEAPKLTQEESRQVIQRVIARSGGKPVVVGVSAPGLAQIDELTAASMDLGAAGVMVAPPSSLRTNESIETYYAQVANRLGAGVPIVLQDFPLSTGVAISNGCLGRIIEANPSIVMLKHEDWPGLEKISELRRAELAGRRRISILCGNAGVFLPEEMARGADGAMTGFAYPEMMVSVTRLMAEGEAERARDIFDAYLPLVRYEQQPVLGLAVRKHVLAARGILPDATIRAPGAPLNAAARAEVDTLIARQTRRLAELGA